MKCEEMQSRLSEYVDDRLEETERLAMDAHLTACPACRHALDALTAMIAELKDEKAVKAPDDFIFQLHKKMNNQSVFTKFFKSLFSPFRMKIPFGFATATAVAVVILVVLQVDQPGKTILQNHKAETQTIRQLESIAAPEKEPVDLSPASDMAEPPAAKPAPPPAVLQKRSPNIILQEKPDFVKEQKGLGMAAVPAAVPEPAGREAQKTIQWVLTVNSTYAEGSSAPTLQKSKTTGYGSLAGTSPDNSGMEKEEAVKSIKNEISGKDEDAKRPYFPMDETVADVEALTGRLGGKVISVKQTRSPNPKCYMTLTIPAEKVKEFSRELDRIGRFDVQPEEFLEFLDDPVIIHLTLIDG